MEEFFQPNTAICCASKEEFAELCEILTDAGFRLNDSNGILNPNSYEVNHDDEDIAQDAIYITNKGYSLMYTSKHYSVYCDDDHPTVVDFCDLFKSRVEISSIDELI